MRAFIFGFCVGPAVLTFMLGYIIGGEYVLGLDITRAVDKVNILSGAVVFGLVAILAVVITEAVSR